MRGKSNSRVIPVNTTKTVNILLHNHYIEFIKAVFTFKLP